MLRSFVSTAFVFALLVGCNPPMMKGGTDPNPSPVLSAVVIAPDSALLLDGDSIALSAVGKLSDGSTTNTAVYWSATGGVVSSRGVYRGNGSSGRHRVTARTHDGSFADTVEVTVVPAPPPPTLTQIVLAPATASLAAGATRQYSVSGAWSDGSTTVPAVTYSATGGTITAGGLYTAGQVAGSYEVTATQQGGSVAGHAGVTVTVPPPPPPPPSGARDPLKWPFAASSIWNMPIGSGAVYVPAGPNGTGSMPAFPGADVWAPMPQLDREHILLTPTAPLTDIMYSSAGWSGANRCAATGGLLVRVPMPANYVVPNSGGNNAGVFLQSDGRTLIQVQPLARCVAGGIATSMVSMQPQDLYGEGILGAHGGSGLSSIGGSIRVGELRPNGQGPRHAIKLNLYAKQMLYKCTTRADCKRWPAGSSDSYAVGWYGAVGDNTNTAMKMGSLLAIPATTDLASLNLETDPARQLAWTLQNYGAYVVDDSWGPGVGLSVEQGIDGSLPTQFQADYGYPMEQRVNSNTPWSRDWQKLTQALWVVNNNGPNSIGGGGTPRQPLAPAFQ